MRLVLEPIVGAATEPLDLKINEWISGYEDKRSSPLLSTLQTSATVVGKFAGNLFPKFTHCSLNTLLEVAKQSGFADTFDETWWFTLSTELAFNIYFFYRSVDSTINDQLLNLLINKSMNLKAVIENFERQRAIPRNASQEKQVEIKQALKEEIYTIVRGHFGQLQPVLLEKMRANHETFKTLTSIALLTPVTIDLLKLVSPLIKNAIN